MPLIAPSAQALPARPDYAAIRALAFDLDGTLVDSLPDLAAAGNRMLGEIGRPPVSEALVRQFIGDGIGVLTRRLLSGDMHASVAADVLEPAVAIFMRAYAGELVARSRPYPGVELGLAAMAARFPLACVTNKAVAFTRPLLEGLGLRHHFALVLGGDSLARKKPDALPFLHCAQVFGVTPAQLLVVGDSPNDCAAARAAACPVVCVPYGYHGAAGVAGLDCDAIVANLHVLASSLLHAQS